ncbi:MAG: hypothetical protein J0M28_08630 [Thauera sp.]|nr:hypothetical protein [Thauera sp.]
MNRIDLRATRSEGQALPLGVFFILATAAVMYLMFNSGRVIDEKLRITNAADGAAYSAAVLEARALNYDAYANRAIVANQVAIAQAISLASWMHYFRTGVDNAGLLGSVASKWIFDPSDYPQLLVLLASFGGSAYLDYLSGGGLEGGLDAAVEMLDHMLAAIVTAHDTASLALSLSQTLIHAELAAGLAQEAIANEVVRRIDPAMRAELNRSTHGFDHLTRSYAKDGSGDERGRLGDVVLRSRDDFSSERKWSLHGPDIWPLQRNVELKRRGGTELINYDEWRAIDTLEHEGQRLRKGSWRWTRTSIAWGAAKADSGDGEPGTASHGNSYRDNPRTTKKHAEPSMSDMNSIGARFSGLPATRDLANLDRTSDPGTGLSIRVSKARHALRTSGGSSVVRPEGRLRQFDSVPPGDEMAALSRAEVFFDRPQLRQDGKAEYASLYNPYWQVRLVSPTNGDRAWAATRQEGVVLP